MLLYHGLCFLPISVNAELLPCYCSFSSFPLSERCLPIYSDFVFCRVHVTSLFLSLLFFSSPVPFRYTEFSCSLTLLPSRTSWLYLLESFTLLLAGIFWSFSRLLLPALHGAACHFFFYSQSLHVLSFADTADLSHFVVCFSR